jgi:uncharacterized protein (UPF0332 family)
VRPADILAKAERALASAKALLEIGDDDGAANRAYYAMFDAARAALMETQAIVETETIRTHSGLITAFSLHLVKTGKVPMEFGRAINKVEEIRLAADYKDTPVEHEAAVWAIEQAEDFVTFIAENLVQRSAP